MVVGSLLAVLLVAAAACSSSTNQTGAPAPRADTAVASGNAGSGASPDGTSSGAARSPSSASGAPSAGGASGGGPSGGGTAGPAVDGRVEAKSISQVEKFFPPVKGKVPQASYDRYLTATCAATAHGSQQGRSAADTAKAIAAAVPPGPSVAQYTVAMLILAEVYLKQSDCGAPHAYAQAVQDALEPLASKAIIDLAHKRLGQPGHSGHSG